MSSRIFPRVFSQNVWLTVTMLIALAASFSAYVQSEKQIDRANSLRHASFFLADQLRQSSEELSRMSRTYVVTGDPRYKKHYQDILDIRDGRKPQPQGYPFAYWDLAPGDGRASEPDTRPAVALLEQMRQAGFSASELGYLAEAKANSDSLTSIEVGAMNLAESVGPEAPANRARALLMLHDDRYHRSKATIMRPINQSIELMDGRTADSVHAAENTATRFRVVFIVCVLLALLMLWRAYVALNKILGGPADEVHAHMLRIGRGDFSGAIGVAPGMEDSVLAGLLAMQTRLKAIEGQRKRTELELRTSAERLNEAQRIAKVGSWELDLVSSKLIWSDEIFRLFEIDPNRFGATYEAFLNAVHPEDRDAVNRAYTASLAKRAPYQISHRLLMADGRIKWVHERGNSEFDAAGRPLRSVGTVQDITTQKLAEDELHQAKRLMDSIVGNIPAMVFLKRAADLRFELFNRAGAELLGFPAEVMLGKNDYDFFPREQADFFTAQDRKVLDSRETVEIPEEVITTARGETRYLSTRKTALRDGDGVPTHLLGISIDITARKQLDAELRIAATAFESQEAMIVTDERSVILRVNRAFTEMSGYAAEELVGQKPSMLKSGRHKPDFYRDMWETIHRTGVWQGEIWDRRKSGEVYPKWLTITAVKSEDGGVTHYVGAHYDITERKKAEEKINELAFYDQLTGLPNRTLLMDRLKQTMAASSRSGNNAALLFIDLDNFKTINDTQGHDVGDLLLRQVAQRLELCVREGDTVARLGGDEFVVILAGLNADQEAAATAVENVAEKIIVSLNRNYQLGDLAHRSTASLGVALFKGDRISIDELMKQADMAMYKSKEAGRNAVRFFDPNMESAVKERASLEEELRRALDQKQFLLYYQAQMSGGRLTGVEALVRWQHPERGMVAPGGFIPLAEDSGLILPLGLWVLETACTQLTGWLGRPEMAELTVAVNVSAHQFRQRDFVDQVLAVLEATGADPQRLKLELTESMLVADVEEIIEKMSALKAKGVGFSLDDFGTGYSSLSYLKRLPLDQLKIDQSFVCNLRSDPNDAAIARTIIALAQSLGLGVIAEGVETATQRDFLASSGCHAYQGYLFSRPLPVAGFEAFARRPS